MTGMLTALQINSASSQRAGCPRCPVCRCSSWVRKWTAMALAPLLSHSCMNSRVLSIVGSSRILQDTAQSAGSSRRKALMMSAASSGLSRSAAPMPPCALKGAVQPMFTSTPRTSPQTCRAARTASAESAVPTWKMTRSRSSAQVLQMARPSRGETKSTQPKAVFSTRTVSMIRRSTSTPLYTRPAPYRRQQSRKGSVEARTIGDSTSRPR
mmetsp:Transcript_106278/g.310727  ORF Transcript_106278/g.310727 Transcript_106278/m.310727 type:complete len:211 (-) Transcript_106278:69-701(-)